MGYYLLLSGLQYQAKYYAQILLKTNPSKVACAKLKISKKSAVKDCKSVLSPSVKEFRWKGVMYDVLARTEAGDTIFFYCYADHQETKLIDNFLDYIGKSSPAKGDDSKFSLKNLVQLFYLNQQQLNAFLPVKEIAYSTYSSRSAKPGRLIFSPPPDCRV